MGLLEQFETQNFMGLRASARFFLRTKSKLERSVRRVSRIVLLRYAKTTLYKKRRSARITGLVKF